MSPYLYSGIGEKLFRLINKEFSVYCFPAKGVFRCLMDSYTLSAKLFGFNLHKHAHSLLRDHFIPHEKNDHKPHVLHHRSLFLYSALLVTAKIAVLSLPLLAPYAPAQSIAVTPDNIVSLTNESRVGFGLTTLQPNPKLAIAAANKARDMMDKAYFAHHSPDGISPWYWFAKAGYDYSIAGENLAIRFDTAEGVTAAWLASPSHKANLLSKDFTQIGVAVLTDNFGTEGQVTIVVQEFGTPTNAASEVTLQQEFQPRPTPAPPSPPLRPPQPVVASMAPVSAENFSEVNISYPLENSFIKSHRFEVFGTTEGSKTIEILKNNEKLGDAKLNASDFSFELAQDLPDGYHEIVARNEKGVSDSVRFTVDTKSPEVYKEKFSVIPKLGFDKTFEVNASVEADSIRTLVSIGSDSAVLERAQGENWSGEITLMNIKGDEAPVEVYAQDIAGNETRLRVGYLRPGSVAGVFSLFGSDSTKSKVSLLGHIVNEETLKNYVQSFYLYFVIFLASALILKIGIKRHIQHPNLVAGGAGVMMLAMVMFML